MEFLQDTRTVRYLPNHGNAGDSLIALATKQLFERLGIKTDNNASHVIAAGGGGLAMGYRAMRNALQALDRNLPILVLPSTIQEAWRLLAEFKDITILARERATYASGSSRGFNMKLCHDTAFSLIDPGGFPSINHSGEPVLRAFRTDGESRNSAASLIQGNRDLSLEQPQHNWNFHNCNKTASWFIGTINGYREIHTDRLHVAIIAALLKKKVHFHPNSYHKNKSVYLLSLREFKNVQFVEDNEDPPSRTSSSLISR